MKKGRNVHLPLITGMDHPSTIQEYSRSDPWMKHVHPHFSRRIGVSTGKPFSPVRSIPSVYPCAPHHKSQ